MKKEKNEGQSLVKAQTELLVRHLDKDGKEIQRRVIKNRCVTTAFVNDIVDVLTATTARADAMILYKWHQSGIGVATETIADTGIGTVAQSWRDSGTQVEGTSANAYKSVTTCTFSSTFSITEHGLFNASATAGGTLMDRTVFAAVNVASGEKIEFTFTIQFTAGG